MHIGLSTILTADSIDIADLAPRAEELGFESIWMPEQPTLPVVTETEIPREWGEITDPFVLLSRAESPLVHLNCRVIDLWTTYSGRSSGRSRGSLKSVKV